MSNKNEFNINSELKKYRSHETLLTELQRKRRFALAGTIGCVALICTNMQLTTDANFVLTTASVVSLPYISSCLSTIQSQINIAIIEKKECERRLEDYLQYETTPKQYTKTK